MKLNIGIFVCAYCKNEYDLFLLFHYKIGSSTQRLAHQKNVRFPNTPSVSITKL